MNKGSIRLIVVLIILAALAFFVLQRPGEQSITGSTGEYLVAFDSASIDRMEIGGSIVLEKRGDEWRITSPMQYRADQNAATTAVGKGATLEITNPVSSNPEKQKLFDVDSSGTLVRFLAGGNEKGGLRIGKMGSSYMNSYVRREGSNDVYLVEGMLGMTFAKDVKQWRDKSIVKREKEFIKNVTISFGDTTVSLVLSDSVWTVNGKPAIETSVSSFLTSLSDFQTDEFIDTAVTRMPKERGVIVLEGIELHFFPQPDGNKYYVRSATSPQLFEVYEWRADQVLKKESDFLQSVH